MERGIFSMYTTREQKPALYIREYSYPKHPEAELGFYISRSITHEVSRSMIDCIDGIVSVVIDQICDTRSRREI